MKSNNTKFKGQIWLQLGPGEMVKKDPAPSVCSAVSARIKQFSDLTKWQVGGMTLRYFFQFIFQCCASNNR